MMVTVIAVEEDKGPKHISKSLKIIITSSKKKKKVTSSTLYIEDSQCIFLMSE